MEFLNNRVNKINLENIQLKERLNNIEFYIYSKNKENENENN